MAGLLRRSMALLPADRRPWAEAVWAEAPEIPAGPQRLTWLTGGLLLTMRQAVMSGEPWYPLAFAAAVGGVAWAAWSGSPRDPATVIDRVDVIAMAVMLAGLSWAVRRISGPVAGSRLARLARAGGYAAILALVLAKSAVERVADAPPNNLTGPVVAWTGEVVFLAVLGGYAAVVLACTARRSPAVPGTVATGTVLGLTVGILAYALGPLGFPLRFAAAWPGFYLYDAAMALGVAVVACAPAAAGWAAVRRAGPGSRVRQGAMAGLCAGTAAALAVTVLSTATIALLPYDAGLRGWAASHIGHWTPVVGQVTPIEGLRVGYVAGNSAFAAGYLIVLLLSPLAGSALAAAGAWGTGRILPRPHQPPVTLGESA